MEINFKKVDMTDVDFNHVDFRWASIGGALVSILSDVDLKNAIGVEGFYDHKGRKMDWKQVRTRLALKKVREKLPYRFKTSLTDEGMVFYAVGVKHEQEKTK